MAEPGGWCTGSVSMCTTFSYDANGNRLHTTFPSGQTEVLTYDTSGRELSVTAKRPSGTTFIFRRVGVVRREEEHMKGRLMAAAAVSPVGGVYDWLGRP